MQSLDHSLAVKRKGEGNVLKVLRGRKKFGEKYRDESPREEGSVDGAGFQRSITQEEGFTLENRNDLSSSEAGRREVKVGALKFRNG